MEKDFAKVSGNWMPNDRDALKDWVNELIERVKSVDSYDASSIGGYKHEEVKKLRDLIENNAGIYVLTNQMIDQALHYSTEDPSGNPQIDSYALMLRLIDAIMGMAPEYTMPGTKGHSLIGFPMNAILNWCMGTPAGYAFFMNESVNKCFEEILTRWGEFLSSDKSLYVLNTEENGWMCDEAKKELHMEEYVCQEEKEHWGFTSWNDFFIREFKSGMREVAGKDDPRVIVSACESAPYRISTDIQLYDKFWLKGQPYSLEHMLNHSPYASEFVGGTIYQAFLSATKYHRWHSPVDGVIEKVDKVPGTYYSELRSYPYDEAGPNNSQGFITQVATRMMIYIRCAEPIGLMCFVAVGMAEVSTCQNTAKEGQTVKKGEELGYFKFGGSTHCLIFRKDVIEDFVLDAIPAPDFNDSKVVKVNSKLALTRKPK